MIKKIMKNLGECIDQTTIPPLKSMTSLVDKVLRGDVLAVKFDLRKHDGTMEHAYGYDFTRTLYTIDPQDYYFKADALKQELINDNMFEPNHGCNC